MCKAKGDNCRGLQAVQVSLVGSAQGLDLRRNFQSFIGLVRVKECVNGTLRIQIIQIACPNKVRVLVSGKYENNI